MANQLKQLKFKIAHNTKDTWRALFNSAKRYQETIMYNARKALEKAGVEKVFDLTDEEVLSYFLPNQSTKVYATANKQNQSYAINGQTYSISNPDPNLDIARQKIIENILTDKKNKRTAADMGRMIAGVYAEKYVVSAVEKHINSGKLKDLAQVGEFLDDQIKQMDFAIQIPVDSISKDLNKNTQKVLKEYGFVFDNKPDVTQPFDVTEQGEHAEALQKINLQPDSLSDGLSSNIIGEVIYSKYYAVQPFFYSNKGNKAKVLMPKDFFVEPKRFEVFKSDFLPEEEVTKEEFIESGYTEEELISMTPEERHQASNIVIERMIKEASLKYLRVRYNPKGGK